MEKVKLTSEQAIVFEDMKKSWLTRDAVLQHLAHGWTKVNHYDKLNSIDDDDFIKAIYIGYEVEYTPEELVKQYYDTVKEFWKDEKFYDQKEKYWGEIRGIEHTLKFLGIEIEGVSKK